MRLGTQRLLSLAAALGIAGSVLASQGCNAITNTTAIQCLSEQECVSKGPGFENTTCDPISKTCVPVEAGVGTCSTNAECTAKNNNVPSICRKSDKTCVVLVTPECPTLLDSRNSAATDDNTIVAGLWSFANLNVVGAQFENISRLVQQQFMDRAGGVPGPGGKPRPVVFLACNEFLSNSNAAAKHMMEDVQVPIAIGPYDDNHSLPVLRDYYIPNGTLAVNPVSLNSSLSSLPGNPFAPIPNFWRPQGDDIPTLQVMAAGISDGGELQKRFVKTSGKDPGPGNWKVMIVKEESFLGENYTNFMLKTLNLNGKTGADLLNDTAHFKVVSMGNPVLDPVKDPDPVAAGTPAVTTAIAGAPPFAPNIVIYLVASQFAVPYVLLPMEFGWPQDGTPLPLHVSTALVFTNELAPIPDLVKRVYFGDLATQPDTPERAARLTQFFQIYNTTFKSQEPTNPLHLDEKTAFSLHYGVYDATYFTMALLAGIGDKPVTGANAAAVAASKFAVSGKVIANDASKIPEMLSAVALGQPVTINGLFAPLAFDPKTGAPSINGSLDCISFDPAAGFQFIPAGYVYDLTSNKAVGQIDPVKCPP
jgi:hypothetical protein